MAHLCRKTYTVFLRAKLSACSGIPYTCSTPGKEISKPTEQGPWNIKTKNLQIITKSQGCLLKEHHKLQAKKIDTQPASWRHVRLYVRVTHPGYRNPVLRMLRLPGF